MTMVIKKGRGVARKRKGPGRVSETMLAPAPPTLGAGEFKARCLELMDMVNEQQREIVITKRGKPVAKLVPATPAPRRKSALGALKGSFEIVGDIVGPATTPEDWRPWRRELIFGR
jgi:prevent-host-death family protein